MTYATFVKAQGAHGLLEALHELRRMALPVCWRCEGRGKERVYALNVVTSRRCRSCAGTGQPARVA